MTSIKCEFCGNKTNVFLTDKKDYLCSKCKNYMNIYIPTDFSNSENIIRFDFYGKPFYKKEYKKCFDFYIVKDFGILLKYLFKKSVLIPDNVFCVPWRSISDIKYDGKKIKITYEKENYVDEKIILIQEKLPDISLDELYKLLTKIYNEYLETLKEYVKQVDENYDNDLKKYNVPMNEKEYFYFEKGLAKKYKEEPSSYKVYVKNDKLYIFNENKTLPKYEPHDTERCKIIEVKDIVEIKTIGNVQDKLKISGGGGEVGGSSIGGAIVGDILYGPAGAIIGSRKQGKIEEVNSEYYRDDTREVQIKLNDENSIILPYFSTSKQQSDKQSEQFDNFYDFLKRNIPKLFIEEKDNNKNYNSKNYITELKELKQLLDDGIISQEEFEKKKQQLLNI